MCNLNFYVEKNNVKKRETAELYNIMSNTSFLKNNDGSGYVILDKKILLKKSKKPSIIKKPISNFFTHQRLSTKGLLEKYIQPLNSKNFILLHNGTFKNLGNEDISDSKIFLTLLEKEYKKEYKKYKNIELYENKLIEEILKKLLKENKGAYSIILIKKDTKKVYYFKNHLRKFYYIDNKNFVAGSSIKENLEMIKNYKKIKNKIKVPKINTLYEISKKGFIELCSLK